VNRALEATIKKWEEKGVGDDEWTEYDRQKDKYFKKLYTGRPGQESFYWFELQQYDPMKWRMIHMEPFAEAYNHQYEILPMDIIRDIANTKVNPNKVITREDVRSGLLDKTVDLQFVHFSDTYMFGTVKEHTGETPGKIRWEGDMEAAFLAFFDCRNRQPRKVIDFVKEFAKGLQPRLVEEGWKPGAEPAGVVRVPDPELKIVPAHDVPGQWNDGGDVDLYRLIALSKAPEYSRLLWLKLEELQNGLLKGDIEAFEEKKRYYYDKLLGCIGMESCINNGRPQPYWFILTKFAPNDWGMTKIDPWPPPYEHFKEVLPPALFDKITRVPVDPDTVIGASMVTPDLLRKKLDVLWVRYASNCVMGVVRENIDEWKRLMKEGKDVLESDPVLKGAAYYNLLFNLMRRDEEVAKSFINAFMTEMRPQLKAKGNLQKAS
jgi:hypothetical protein